MTLIIRSKSTIATPRPRSFLVPGLDVPDGLMARFHARMAEGSVGDPIVDMHDTSGNGRTGNRTAAFGTTVNADAPRVGFVGGKPSIDLSTGANLSTPLLTRPTKHVTMAVMFYVDLASVPNAVWQLARHNVALAWLDYVNTGVPISAFYTAGGAYPQHTAGITGRTWHTMIGTLDPDTLVGKVAFNGDIATRTGIVYNTGNSTEPFGVKGESQHKLHINQAAIWDRVLSDAEIKLVHKNLLATA